MLNRFKWAYIWISNENLDNILIHIIHCAFPVCGHIPKKVYFRRAPHGHTTVRRFSILDSTDCKRTESKMELEILNAKNSKPYGKVKVPSGATPIGDLRALIHKTLKQTPHANRQSLRLELKGKSLKDTDTLESLSLRSGDKIYVKDLGPQIGWKTVFLAEYAGPLIVYLIFYFRPELVYGKAASLPISLTTQ